MKKGIKKERFVIKEVSKYEIHDNKLNYYIDVVDSEEKAKEIKKHYEEKEGKYYMEEEE